MRRTLLLVATLGSFAMLAAPASAGDYRTHRPPVTSSFHLGIFVSPTPKTVHYYHPRPRYLHPQPVYRYVHPLPRPRWYSWHRPAPRHFDRRHHGHAGWRHDGAKWRDGDRDRRHGDEWRHGDRDRRHGDGWRNRSGRDYAGHDRRRD
jgi:hypothetical protein